MSSVSLYLSVLVTRTNKVGLRLANVVLMFELRRACSFLNECLILHTLNRFSCQLRLESFCSSSYEIVIVLQVHGCSLGLV